MVPLRQLSVGNSRSTDVRGWPPEPAGALPVVLRAARLMRARKAAALLASAAFAAVGGSTLMHRRRRQRGDYRIVILEYHDTGPDGAKHELVVSASRFRRHLRYLRRYYRLISLSEAVVMLAKPGELLYDDIFDTIVYGYA